MTYTNPKNKIKKIKFTIKKKTIKKPLKGSIFPTVDYSINDFTSLKKTKAKTTRKTKTKTKTTRKTKTKAITTRKTKTKAITARKTKTTKQKLLYLLLISAFIFIHQQRNYQNEYFSSCRYI